MIRGEVMTILNLMLGQLGLKCLVKDRIAPVILVSVAFIYYVNHMF